jgi:ribonuclease HI
MDLQQVLEHFKIEDWDALMIGDGSGSRFDRGCGWATFLFQRHKSSPQVFYGGFSHGTNNIAEIMAYLQPLLWYSSLTDVKNARQGRKVHIITDSEYVANMGANPDSRKKHVPLWRALDAFKRKGIQITWHHLHRNRSSHNIDADRLSRSTRITLEQLKPQFENPLT